MTKRTLAWVVAALPVAITTTAVPAQKDAGRGYELQNVEVLDPSMRLADARRYMVSFNEALGVQCRDCHVLQDFSSDEKTLKVVARQMMKMQVEINEHWFGQLGEVVTCWTCHRGERVPPNTSLLSAAMADSVLKSVDRETSAGE